MRQRREELSNIDTVIIVAYAPINAILRVLLNVE